MNDKRGLSAVVATLIIVLLVLVATGIVWVVIRNIVSQGAEEISLDKISYDVDIEAAYLSGTDAVVSVKRNAGGGEVTGIKFIFYNDQTSTSVERDVMLEQLDRKTFTFNSNEIPANTNNLEVSISLIYVSKGEEKFTDVSATRKVASGASNILVLRSNSGNNLVTDDLLAIPQNFGPYNTLIYDWKLDGNSIAVLNLPFDSNVNSLGIGDVKDYSDFHNDATLGGGVYAKAPIWNTTAISGGAYSFDGVDEIIKLQNPITVSRFSGTLSWWAKPSSTASTGFLSQVEVSYSSHLELRNDRIFAETDTNCNNFHFLSITKPTSWTYYAVVFNNSRAYLYLNGVYQKEADDYGNYTCTSGAAPSMINNFTFQFIGARTAYNGNFFGAVDEVKIYDRALSAEQIAAMYNSGVPSHDKIVSQETSSGDSWSVTATLNDQTSDTDTILSNSLTIV